MSTFTTDFAGFKQLCSEFLKAMPATKNLEQLNAGFKCMLIGFVNMKGDENETHQARVLYDIVERKFHKRERELMFAPVKEMEAGCEKLITAIAGVLSEEVHPAAPLLPSDKPKASGPRR